MSSAIQYLREIADRCLEGKPLDEELSEWLGGSIQNYLTRCCQTIDDAFGLKFPQGGIPWWREEANRARDAALRELAETFFADRSTTEKAREIATLATRYAATGWRFEEELEALPEHFEGTVRGYLWQAFKSGAVMPIGERQLRNIIGT